MQPTFFVLEKTSGYTKYEHLYRSDAEKEAERLARQNPGKEFFVLAKIGVCKTMDVFWEHLDPCEAPF